MILSIITPAYNARDTIETTLKSVLLQESKSSVEYIVVDGGSSDGTVDLLREYKNHLEWMSESDDGIYDAMNKGIRRARGDWIGILNSDDWYAKHTFQELEAAVQRHPRAGIVVGGVTRVSEDGTTGKYVPPPQGAFTTLNPNNHPATFVHRDVYERLGTYRLSYPISADLDFILRAQKEGCPIVREDTLFTYMREGGASSGFKGILESCAIENKYGHSARAVRVLLRKMWQKGRRSALKALLPSSASHALRKAWWSVRRDRRALTEDDHWVQHRHLEA
ncbi:glycosyltransferase family 2 protein [Salinibacter pepae]|uniref:glycosyltransferase family 2 protein n=1 Tax=Salinibacter pepae TaxID=3040382 RepID=UPI0021E7F697|nr:glycosyltransferase family 2 protein [Salinibacter pepae]